MTPAGNIAPVTENELLGRETFDAVTGDEIRGLAGRAVLISFCLKLPTFNAAIASFREFVG